jgi:hypothetical protein
MPYTQMARIRLQDPGRERHATSCSHDTNSLNCASCGTHLQELEQGNAEIDVALTQEPEYEQLQLLRDLE